MLEEDKAVRGIAYGSDKARKLAAIAPYEAEHDSPRERKDEALNAKGALNTPIIPINKHISRRASAVQGMKVLDKLRRAPSTRRASIRKDGTNSSDDGSCSDESEDSSGDDMEEISKEEQAMAAALQRERKAHARATMLAKLKAQEEDIDAFIEELSIDESESSEEDKGSKSTGAQGSSPAIANRGAMRTLASGAAALAAGTSQSSVSRDKDYEYTAPSKMAGEESESDWDLSEESDDSSL
jgi:hypothetical protein